ncbi:DUF4097 domain-containing protein [Paenibacillus sp. MER TA 81-3]|uniref:DUF4097 family beta strand repeat-containing protein n=1 Tax=Paenibacillus sp. MER TA 81-3 TaxID=2939573 RepID=UPI00203DC431|nr:DUF4097 family beta strand repeat-containing protein [Paenibacillus sp. MER TA 81-3]MCM3339359.1 DUF4097 domain-containing protein [Paenibacillus sp. MER TA 81-3]
MRRVWLNLLGIGCIVAGIAGLFYFGMDKLLYSQLPGYNYSIAIEPDLEQIEMEANRSEIKVNWHFDEQRKIELSGQAPEQTIQKLGKTKVENGVLRLDYNDTESAEWLNLFQFNSRQQHHEIHIHAPKELVLDRFQARLAMGSFVMTDGQVKQLDVESNLGQVIVKQVKGEQVKLKSDAGKIVTENVDAAITVNASLGEVKLLNTTRPVDIDASAGNVFIEQQNPHPIQASSNLGNIKILVSPLFDGVYDARANLGNVSSPESKMKSNMVIQVRTDAGNISIVEK